MRSKILIGLVLSVCVVLIFLSSRLYREVLVAYEQSGTLNNSQYSWFFRLLLNLSGYATVLLPGYLVYKYIQKTNYFDKVSNPGVLSRCLVVCFGPGGERLPDSAGGGGGGGGEGGGGGGGGGKAEESPRREAAELAFCFAGLMGSYLVWGLLQEKIMTQSYVMADGSVRRWSDSQLLVLLNRLLALLVAALRLLATRRPLVGAPLHGFSYCALTNVLSAWCQYEALKYVSFPMQVLSKSCKVIPVMLMGKLVSGNKYEPYEYVTAAMISAGMMLFMLTSKEGHGEIVDGAAPLWSGLALLALYMCCDSFTASWQGALFRRHRCSPLQMLCGVNLFSCLLTAASLLHQPANPSWQLLQHPQLACDVVLLSASSAAGQLFIYRTIDRFGAVAFAVIMTLRQAVSVLLSCAVFGHALGAAGALGAGAVFAAAALRVYCRQRLRRRRTLVTAK